jgi:aminomethyltransferase
LRRDGLGEPACGEYRFADSEELARGGLPEGLTPDRCDALELHFSLGDQEERRRRVLRAVGSLAAPEAPRFRHSGDFEERPVVEIGKAGKRPQLRGALDRLAGSRFVRRPHRLLDDPQRALSFRQVEARSVRIPGKPLPRLVSRGGELHPREIQECSERAKLQRRRRSGIGREPFRLQEVRESLREPVFQKIQAPAPPGRLRIEGILLPAEVELPARRVELHRFDLENPEHEVVLGPGRELRGGGRVLGGAGDPGERGIAPRRAVCAQEVLDLEVEPVEVVGLHRQAGLLGRAGRALEALGKIGRCRHAVFSDCINLMRGAGLTPGRARCNFAPSMATETALVLKRTPLYAVHKELGAKMVDFGGWEMPVEYSGIRDEHRAVRERAGLFDVSHMGEFLVEGPDALSFLQRLTSNDVAKLEVGRCHYSAMLTPRGTFVDDLLVYRLGLQKYLLVVNAGNTPKDFDHALSLSKGFRVTLEDRSTDYALLALQGPRAQEVLVPMVAADLPAIPYYGFIATEVSGARAVVSRTGYTGENGFEIYCEPGEAPRLFREILKAGRTFNVLACGLGARDTLRLEAKMALYGNDIDDTVTPFEADLAWIVKMDKGDFEGKEALARQKADGLGRKLVGFELLDRGIARHGYEARSASGRGVVTSGIPSPTLGRSIGLAYLPIGDTAVGTEFHVDLRGRPARARVVETPFYKRAK